MKAAAEVQIRIAPPRASRSAPRTSISDRAPDLAIEIRPPADAIAGLLRKMKLYLAHGARLGWIVLPEERSVLVAAPDGAVRALPAGETLDGRAVLSGLRIPVAEIFA